MKARIMTAEQLSQDLMQIAKHLAERGERWDDEARAEATRHTDNLYSLMDVADADYRIPLPGWEQS